MSDSHESYPSMHPSELVSPSEFYEIQNMSKAELRHLFDDRYNNLLADIYQNLSDHNALEAWGGWAAYTNEAEYNQYSQIDAGNGDVLVLYAAGYTHRVTRHRTEPFVRVTSTELFWVEDGTEYITYDLSIDRNGDAFYRYGSFPHRKSVSEDTALVPMFQYDDKGRIRCSEDKLTSRALLLEPGIEDTFMPDVILVPFGQQNDIHTKLTVIGCMQAILDKLRDSKPNAWNGMTKQNQE